MYNMINDIIYDMMTLYDKIPIIKYDDNKVIYTWYVMS